MKKTNGYLCLIKYFCLFFIIITITFGFTKPALAATDFYVDFTNGSDSNSGTIDAPLKNHPWMSTFSGSVTLQAGDTVYMKRGETWSVSSPTTHYVTVKASGSENNYITTTAYGTGNKPLIKISTDTLFSVVYGEGKSYIKFDNLHIEHWSDNDYGPNSQDGIQFRKDSSNNVPHDWIITNNEINNIPGMAIQGFNDSYNITIGDVNATRTATQSEYSNNIHDFGYSGITLLGNNPVDGNSNFNVYYNYIHDGNRSTCGDNEYGISFGVRTGSSGWPTYVNAKYNRIENLYTWEGIDIHGGSYITFSDNYVYNTPVPIVMFKDLDSSYSNEADYWYVDRNTIENPSNQQCLSLGKPFIKVNGSTPKSAENVFIRNNSLSFTASPSTSFAGYGIEIRSANNVEISSNEIFNGATSASRLAAIALYNGPIGDVTIKNNYIHDWPGGGIAIEQAGQIINPINVIGNIIYSNKILNLHYNDLTGNLNVLNNTFINNNSIASNLVFEQAGVASGVTVTEKNNIFSFSPSQNSYYFYGPSSNTTGTYSIDNNLYYNSTYATPFDIPGSAPKNWANWKSAGYDSASQGPNVNPLFKNTSVNNYTLEYNSPAIDAGVSNTLVATDRSGNPIYGTPDIGAYEYQPPYTLGTDLIDPTGNIRIYGDRKYRYTNSPSGSATANFSVSPAGGNWTYSGSSVRPEWLNVSNITWNNTGTRSKQWTAQSSIDTSIVYSIGDLLPSTPYDLAVDGVVVSTVTSNSSGVATYTYSGGQTSHAFTVNQNTSGVIVSPVSSPQNPSNTQTNSSNTQTTSSNTQTTSTTPIPSTSGGSTSSGGATISPSITYPTSTTPSLICTPSTSSFTRNLTLGSRGNDVKALQVFLNTKGFKVSVTGIGSPGNESDYFGPATRAALAKFQAANSISPAAGYFGPLTIRTVSSANSGASCIPSTPVITNNYTSTTGTFTRNLTLGSRGNDVKALQVFLNTKGFKVSVTGIGSPGNESDYFGPATRSALAKFQAANGIVPAVGYFGEKTRAVIK